MTTDDDEELLAELRHLVARADPVPPTTSEVARSLLSWRDPDARFAELVADSRTTEAALRGDTAVILEFRAGPYEIVVQVEATGADETRLIGHVEPPMEGSVSIRRPDGSVEVGLDDLGRFALSDERRGPISLRVVPSDGSAAVETAWQLI